MPRDGTLGRMANIYEERLSSRSPNTSSHDHQGGSRATWTYYVANTGTNTLNNAIDDILGYAWNDDDGDLGRVPPACHPQHPHLYADRIVSITGTGVTRGDVLEGLNPDADDVEGPGPLTEQTTKYSDYEIVVSFSPRLYSVADDDAVNSYTMGYYNEDGVPGTLEYRDEWVRFCDEEPTGQPELITAQQGMSYFVTAAADIDVDPIPTARPHGIPFPGFPRILAAREVLLFRWYHVPYDYVTSANSYIRKYQGYINQAEWNGHAAGALLYDRFEAKRFVPARPDLVPNANGGGFTARKFCDVTFVFLKVYRTQSSVPDFSAINPNWVPSGHNLQPWFGDRDFYHVVYPKQTAKNDTAFWQPTYPSIPFQILFQNPDAV